MKDYTDQETAESFYWNHDEVYANMPDIKPSKEVRRPRMNAKPEVKENPNANNRRWKIIMAIVIFLLLMFLALIIFTSLLYIFISKLTTEWEKEKQAMEMKQREMNEVKSNVSELMEEWEMEKQTKLKPCGSGWLAFQGSCYFFSTVKVSWETARILCQTKECDLAIITSEEEQEFLNKNTHGNYYWIGLIDEQKNKVFKWVDGTDISYSNWHKGEPNHGGGKEHCSQLWISGNWNDLICSQKIFPLCEKRF